VARKKKSPPPRGPQLEMAGALCVAFVNTASARPNNTQQGVANYAELLIWGQQVGVLSTLDGERLRRLAAERPQDAAAVYAAAAKLRLVLIRLFHASRKGKDLPQADLDAFNAALAEALPAQRLVRGGDSGLTWGWAGDAAALDRVLWPVLHSAAETLIATAGRPHVRQCAYKGCTLYFVDSSPRQRRRWCDRKVCGNRAAALEYYYREGRAKRDKKMRSVDAWKTRRPRKKARS